MSEEKTIRLGLLAGGTTSYKHFESLMRGFCSLCRSRR